MKRFATANEYVDSDIGKKIVEEFTSRKSREFDYADVKIYHCRYSRRVGFKPCPWMFKVSFLTRCSDVIVETNDGLMDHLHDEDPEYELNPGAVFKWTEEMNKIIEEGVVNHAKPNVIKRNLNEANLFLSRKPSTIQLYNKIAAVRKRVFPSINIVNTHQMRQRISNVLEIPASEVEGYVPYWEIDDENDEKEPRFLSSSLQRRIRKNYPLLTSYKQMLPFASTGWASQSSLLVSLFVQFEIIEHIYHNSL